MAVLFSLNIPQFISLQHILCISISKSGALHIFQSGINISPVAYLIQYRLAQAATLLYATIFEKEAGRCITHYFAPVPEGQKFVTVIAGCDSATVYAEETGFTSSGYFCRKFRQHYLMSPNQYRQKKT